MCVRHSPTPASIALLLSASVLVFVLTIACQTRPTPTPQTTSTTVPTALPTLRSATPTPTPDPEAALGEARLLMLELINEARADAGVPPVELGDNRAAQIHAENLAEVCAAGHWGLDGTKPVMRYSLAGGYQVNAENVSAIPWCEDSKSSAALQVRDAIEGWLASAGHRVVMLDRVYRKVNVGLAFNDNGYLVAVQQFEGDYVEYSVPPHIEGGSAAVRGASSEPSDAPRPGRAGDSGLVRQAAQTGYCRANSPDLLRRPRAASGQHQATAKRARFRPMEALPSTPPLLQNPASLPGRHPCTGYQGRGY